MELIKKQSKVSPSKQVTRGLSVLKALCRHPNLLSPYTLQNNCT